MLQSKKIPMRNMYCHLKEGLLYISVALDEPLGGGLVTVVDELEVHVDEDRVEDERELVPVQVERAVDEADKVVVGVLINCRVVVGLRCRRLEDYALALK